MHAFSGLPRAGRKVVFTRLAHRHAAPALLVLGVEAVAFFAYLTSKIWEPGPDLDAASHRGWLVTGTKLVVTGAANDSAQREHKPCDHPSVLWLHRECLISMGCTSANVGQLVSVGVDSVPALSAAPQVIVLGMAFFGLSAVQTRYRIVLKHGNMPVNDHLEYWSFLIYRVCPFLHEIRTILDWTITHTALDLFQWFKLEDSFNNLIVVRQRLGLEGGCSASVFIEVQVRARFSRRQFVHRGLMAEGNRAARCAGTSPPAAPPAKRGEGRRRQTPTVGLAFDCKPC